MSFSKSTSLTPTKAEYAASFKSLKDAASALTVDEWVELVGKSTEENNVTLNQIQLPTAPPIELQAIFHGVGGRAGVISGASMYRHVLEVCNKYRINNIHNFLDFGCGWGRFSRLFLRDVEVGGMYGIDPWLDALQMCREHFPYAAFLKSELLPPLPFRDSMFDVVFANSIFSHLPELNAVLWISEITRVLRPGGILIGTTHSKNLLDTISRLKDGSLPPAGAWHETLSNRVKNIDFARSEHAAGNYVYFSTVTDSEGRDHPDYGDTLVPEEYIKRVWGRFLKLLEYVDDATKLPQATFVLQKI